MSRAFATYPSLKGKGVFITGGATGIGAALVRAFHAQGAKVAFIDLAHAEGEALERDCPGTWFARIDVRDAHVLERAIDAAAKSIGPITVLINNVANDTRHAAADMEAAAWRANLSVNLDPTFIASRAVHAGMVRAGGGSIINLSSINATLGPAGMAAYVAAKGAVNALTKSLAREWGAAAIRVNAIAPGWVVTERQLALWLTPEAEAEWMKQTALQTRIQPEDVARLALFLAADDSAMITAQVLTLDGGRT